MQVDIRVFIDQLEKEGKLIRETTSVDLLKIPKLMLRAEKSGRASFFDNIKNYDIPVLYNTLGGRDFLALAFGCTRNEVLPEFIRRSAQPLDPVLVENAPVHQVVALAPGDQLDIERFPFLVHSAKDAGRYITAGVVIAKDPETGIRNASINRMQLKGKQKLGIRMMPPQHLGIIYEKAEKLGKPLEVAVAVGNHPLDLIAATTSGDLDMDELAIAGGLRQEPLELVKCKTVDLEVPARAEIIIEGEVRPREREVEGPFGDFMGYYVPSMDNHVLHIKAITTRKDPVLQVMKAGSLEDTQLLGLSREAAIYKAVKATGAEITALTLNPTIFSCNIAIKKRFANEANRVLMAAFGSYSWLKTCIIVDHDVDVFDANDMLWAVGTRSRPDQGVLVIPNAEGFPRDPYGIHQSKLGIDATIPLGQWQEFERITLPEA